MLILASVSLAAAPAGADVSLTFERNGNAIVENALVRTEVSSRPGREHGLRSWHFKPTGHEMVDVLYGQTDYVHGGLLGEIFDKVALDGAPAGQPQVFAGYYVIDRAGVVDSGRAALIEQTASTSGIRLTRTVTFRRDLAVAQVRLAVENQSGPRIGTTLRLFGAMSPGARGRAQDRNHVIYMPLSDGVAALDQSLQFKPFIEKYGTTTFCLAEPAQGPLPSYAREYRTLAASWAAMVHPGNGDGLVMLAALERFMGFYSSPGTTLEPFFVPVALTPGQVFTFDMYVGAFTGAAGQTVTDATPLFVVIDAVRVLDGALSGRVIPMFKGTLTLVDSGGAAVAAWPASPDQPLELSGKVAHDWRLVALDTAGQEIGRMDARGEVTLAPVDLEAPSHEPPAFAGDVYVNDADGVTAFLADRDFTVYCDDAASRREKLAAAEIAKRFGVGIAWTRIGGKMLVVGEPATNPAVRDTGQLRHSVSSTWPGAGRGAILAYDNLEPTTRPVLLIAGGDDFGVARAAEVFLDRFARDVQPPTGMTAWVPNMESRVYPYTRAPADPETVIRASAARGEYEPAMVAFTAHDALHKVKVTVSPLKHRESGAEIGSKYLTKHRRDVGPVWVRWINYFPANPEGGWTGHPDPLLERPETFVPAGETRGLWLTFVIPDDAAAGVYDAQLTIASFAGESVLPIELEVYDFDIPRTGLIGQPYMAMDMIGSPNRPIRDREVRALVSNMVEHGMRMLTPSSPGMFRWSFSPKGQFKGFQADAFEVSDDGKVMLDATHFEWLIEQCEKAGKPFDLLYMIYANNIVADFGRFRNELPNRYPDKEPIPSKLERTSRSWYTVEMYQMLERYLTRRKLIDRVVIKVADEPAGFNVWYDDNCWSIRHTSLPIMTAFNKISWTEAERGLGSQLKLWQPLYMLHNQSFLDRAKASGALVSWYNCGPPPQITVSAPRSALRSYLWQAAKAELDVISWWGIQCWIQIGGASKVWESRYSHWHSVIYPPHPVKQPTFVSGRGWIDSPFIDSIRWELIRDGMDDAAYVMRLRELIAKARANGRETEADAAQAVLDQIWTDIFPTLNDYQPPYEVLTAARDRVARAIVELTHPSTAQASRKAR